MASFAGVSLLQTAVALGIVASLCRVWKLRRPEQRLVYFALVLAVPLFFHPALLFLAPWRTEPRFQETLALLSFDRWHGVRFMGFSAEYVIALLAAGIGLLLFVRDLLSALHARLVSPPESTPMRPEMADETMAIAVPLAEAMGTPLPRCVFLDDEEPRLFLSGVRSPRLTISRGAVDLLPPPELRIAIAHELAHRERNDLALGWFLMLVRAVLFFNPLAQVVGRKILHDVERRADERAIQITGDRFLAASALARFAGPDSGAQDVSRRAPEVCPSPPDIGARWQNLVDPDFGRRLSLPGARLALTALAVATICVFVV